MYLNQCIEHIKVNRWILLQISSLHVEDMDGCLFVAKFNDWLSCAQHVDLKTFKNRFFNIQQ